MYLPILLLLLLMWLLTALCQFLLWSSAWSWFWAISLFCSICRCWWGGRCASLCAGRLSLIFSIWLFGIKILSRFLVVFGLLALGLIIFRFFWIFGCRCLNGSNGLASLLFACLWLIDFLISHNLFLQGLGLCYSLLLILDGLLLLLLLLFRFFFPLFPFKMLLFLNLLRAPLVSLHLLADEIIPSLLGLVLD